MDQPGSLPAVEMVGVPDHGRVFRSSGRVRLGDSSPGGRLRFDAIARMLHDVSDDDTRDAGLDEGSWVVRRTAITVSMFPRYLEPLVLTTWCSGLGQRWAERRTVIAGGAGGLVDAATVWVQVDPTSMRPARLPQQFLDLYGPSAHGREVSSRLTLAPPVVRDARPAVAWSPRFTDFDVLGHVNNAVAWAMLEELLAGRRDLRAPLEAIVEYGAAIDRGADVAMTDERSEVHLAAWVTSAGHRPLVSMLARRPLPNRP